MTTPKHAREIKGKGRYYGACCETCPLGDRLYISVTNAQSVINKPALPPSAAKLTAETAWKLLPLMVATSRQAPEGPNGCEKRRVAERCGRCRFCINAAIKAEYRAQWETKMELGTRIHAHAHAHVLGRPIALDEEVEPYLGEYIKFLLAWGIDPDRHVEAAETTVVDRRYGYAGTGDVWIWLPTGRNGKRELWLIDIKTSVDKPVDAIYPDQEIQLAGLRYAPKAILPDDTEVDVPKFAGAAILNLRTDAHALVPLPTTRDAHKAFLGAVTLQRHFHGQDTKAWIPLDAPVLPEPKPGKVA